MFRCGVCLMFMAYILYLMLYYKHQSNNIYLWLCRNQLPLLNFIINMVLQEIFLILKLFNHFPIIIIVMDPSNYLILSQFVLSTTVTAYICLIFINIIVLPPRPIWEPLAGCSYLNFLKLNKIKISFSLITFQMFSISEQNRFRTFYHHRKFYLSAS